MKRLSVLAAVVLVVLMVHAWGGSAAGVSPLASCSVDCTGVSNGGKIPDPYNCTNFYYCNNGDEYGPAECPSGHFDPTEGDCVGTTECEPECGGGANCPLTCNETLTSIGNAFNCSVYYFCTPGGPKGPISCPPDRPNYDANTQVCVDDESVCCSGYCEPYCDGTVAVVPDPEDCTRFYFCDGEGVPENSFQCSGGGYFDVQLGDCVSGPAPNPCPTLCSAAGGGGGSTTTTTSTSSTSTDINGNSSTEINVSTSTDINGCVTSLVCTAQGNFPACSDCQPEYFQCSGEGAMGVLDSCTDDTVFNPTPGYPYCILPSNCPYP